MEEQKTASIIYERNKNAITFPVNGVVGGGIPDNTGVAVHFYIEHLSIPHSTTYKFLNENILDMSSEENIKRGDITREIQATTILTPELAKLIGQWLIKNADEVISRRKGNQ